MAEPPNSNPSFTNREKDRHDPDVKSEADAEISRLREAGRVRRAVQEAYCKIPKKIYDKAREHPDQLTDEERQVFLNCGDVLGKVVAYPDSATTEEIYEALAWPPPDVVRAKIQRATGGKLSTPTELYAKAQDALDNDQFDTLISDGEMLLIVNGFKDDLHQWKSTAPHAVPGFGHALVLPSGRLGLDIVPFQASWQRRSKVLGVSGPEPSATTTSTPQDQPNQKQPPPEVLEASRATMERLYRRGEISEESYLAFGQPWKPRRHHPYIFLPVWPMLLDSGHPASFGSHQGPSRTDLYGSGPWPYFNAPVGGLRIFMEDTGFTGTGIHPAWSVLPEEQKEAYRARAEARRRDAWAAYEGYLAQKDAMSTLAAPRPVPTAAPGALPLEEPPGRHDHNPSLRPIHVYGFELFRDEIVAGDGGLGFWEVVARWEALPGRQQALYDNRARQIVRAEIEAECGGARVIAERQAAAMDAARQSMAAKSAAARAAEADAGGSLESDTVGNGPGA